MGATNRPSAKCIKLRSSDNMILEISIKAAHQSITIKKLMDNNKDQPVLPISDVKGKTLKKVIEWCERHRGEELLKDEPLRHQNVSLPDWDNKFLNVNNTDLHDLVCAANNLEVPLLVQYCCKRIAMLGEGKPVAEMLAVYDLS